MQLRRTTRRIRLLALASALVGVFIASMSTISVSASTAILRPNGDPASSVWTATPSVAKYSILDNDPPVSGEFICRPGNGNSSEYYDLTTVDVGQGATSATYTINGAADYKFLSANVPYIVKGIQVDGAIVGTVHKSDPPARGSINTNGCAASNVNAWPFATLTTPAWTAAAPGYWTQSQVDSMKMLVGIETHGDDRSMAIRMVYITLTYDKNPQVSAYTNQTFQNSNSLTPGAEITSGFGTDAPLTSHGQKFRLRMVAYNSTGDAWRSGYGALKLQYAKRAVGDACSTSVTGWTDVTSSSHGVQFYDNPNLTNGASIASVYLADTSIAGSVIGMQYRESNDATTNSNLVSTPAFAGWDYSLQASDDSYGGAYCFKLVPTSSLITEEPMGYTGGVTLYADPLSVDFVTSTGTSVANPTIQFPNVASSDSVCQVSSTVLGSTNQRLRVVNGTATGNWSVSIAAANGTTSQWTSQLGDTYDFNDPGGSGDGCTDGGDSDTRPGRLYVDASSMSLTASPNCAMTGLTLGSPSSFVEGSLNSITLLSGTSSSQLYCAWDLQGIGLEQKIPVSTQRGMYSLDLMVTTTAS